MLLYEQITNFVLDQIKSGELAPGDRVPSEMELAERFEVSRITSKRALEDLREAGVIERIRGKGSFVVPELPDLDQASPVTAASRIPKAIGLVIPDVSETYGLELLCAIEEQCLERGVNLVVRRTRGRQDEEERAIETLAGVVEGLIVFPVHGEFYNASLLRAILDGYPVVLVDRFLAGIPGCAVLTDNVAAAKELTGRVLDLGHRTVAFVSPPPENTSSIEARMEGFTTAFTERGLAVEQQRMLTDLRCTLPGAFTAEEVASDVERLRAFVAAEPDVTAFVACEYNLARVIARALDDRLIACFDSPSDPVDGPAFLHVRQDQRAMGQQAVELLLAQVRGEEVQKQSIVPFVVVER